MGKNMNAVLMTGALIAGAGSMAACSGGAETYGPGSVATPEGQCADTTYATDLVHEGQTIAIAVDDLTVRNRIFDSAMEDVNDQLNITAVGVEDRDYYGDSEDEVTEIVISNPDEGNDATIEIISGLDYDQTMQGDDDEIRVDLEDLRDKAEENGDEGDNDHVMEVREDDRLVTITVSALATGATVQVVQDCEVLARVDD